MTEEIKLERVCNKISWGFRLIGGRDFSSPLTVLRIHGGSIAEKGGLKVGDIITNIGDNKTNHLNHAEAQRYIIDSGNSLKLTVLRGSCPDVQRAITPITPIHETTPAPLFLDAEQKKTTTASVSSMNSLYEDDSFELLEESDNEFLEEYHEPTEEEIEEMLLENAEVLEEKGKKVIGVNFHRFIPKCDFIKDSAVFHVLQEEQVHKELSEKEQLAKCPNKRFSTFLARPDRPILLPKRLLKKQHNVETIDGVVESANNTKICYEKDSVDRSQETDCSDNDKSEPEIKNANLENKNSQNNQSENENSSKQSELFINSENINPVSYHEIQLQIKEDNGINTYAVTENSEDFEVQLKNIKNTLSTLQQIPSLIQSQLENIQSQINNLLNLKEDCKQNDEHNQLEKSMRESSNIFESGQDTNSPIVEEYDNSQDEELYSDYNEESKYGSDEILNVEYTGQKQQKNDEQQNISPEQLSQNNESQEKNHQDESITSEQHLRKRHVCPLTPLPRPVVLPGGRIWRKPQDAYNEEFIAETLISQAEVLVGSTLGVNFRKYEPPKFDLSNSAVYKLIHNLESKPYGLENRDTIPALQDYYQSPVSSNL